MSSPGSPESAANLLIGYRHDVPNDGGWVNPFVILHPQHKPADGEEVSIKIPDRIRDHFCDEHHNDCILLAGNRYVGRVAFKSMEENPDGSLTGHRYEEDEPQCQTCFSFVPPLEEIPVTSLTWDSTKYSCVRVFEAHGIPADTWFMEFGLKEEEIQRRKSKYNS